MRHLRLARLLLSALLLPAPAFADGTAGAPDYSAERNWLCKPGRVDACSTDITATAIASDGRRTVEAFVHSASESPVDCFYVYPTVSTQDAELSDLAQESAQFSRVRTQFARYANACRPFAPMYRQVTLKTMAQYAVDVKRFDPNAALAAAPQYRTAYGDVLAAWKHYLAHDNGGRGVILVGHSQGAFILRDLLKAEIDGKDLQKQLVSAHLAGVVIASSKTDPAKNEFKALQPCRDGAQTGCFISFSSFPENAPPPSWSKAFGMTTLAGAVNNCSNPAELSGDGGRLIPYVDASRRADDGRNTLQWMKTEGVVGTPLIALPEFFEARCVTRDDGAGYLAIGFADASARKDVRERIVPGRVHVGPTWLSNWGTHDADMELALGNLVKIAARQASRWSQQRDSGVHDRSTR